MGLFDIFGTDAQDKAADAQRQGLSNANAAGQASLTQGVDALKTNYAAGLVPFQQNYNQAQTGATQYGNALGLNGAAGNAAALQGFQNNPGMQFQLEQGNENILRNQARAGQLASGATNIDLQKFGQGQANQNWSQYISQLLPYLDQTNKAATGIGTLDASLGNQLNSNFNNQANMNYGTQAGIGNANANADLAALNASANGWGAITQGAKLAAGLFGGFGMPSFGSAGGGSTGSGFVGPPMA